MDYEAILEQVYSQLIKKDDHIIDIGAHSGRHTKPIVALVGQKGKVFAFEPNPTAREYLQANIPEALDAGIVKLFPYAVSDVTEKTTFVIADDRPEESGLLERQYNGPTTTSEIEVEVVTLDSLSDKISGKVKFIKIDVEGAEYNALKGAYNRLKLDRPYIAFEFGEASYQAYDVNPAEVFDYLAELGYDIYSILGEHLNQQQFVTASKVQSYWDYIACPVQQTVDIEDIFNKIHKKPSAIKQFVKKLFSQF
ncbi:MAG: FkbM family methyltransferase [gamma proteobacterium symbiont of Taylorina sp.]|nr:FkbM family methyltransferase [gamma proteobacterium symbiont of Taylorina sp.]